MQTGFWWGNLKERVHFENLVMDGKMTFKCILQKGVDLIDLTEDGDMVLVITAMNFYIKYAEFYN